MLLPEEFKDRMKKLLGSEYEEFMLSYNKEKVQGLRINTLKLDVADKDRLPFKLDTVPWVYEGFYYNAEERPGRHPLHEAGVYYIQEPSAMSVASLLEPEEGSYICDMCAAPGGKSTHIAARLKGTGLLVSNEISVARAKILSQNIERAGISNAVVCNETPEKMAEYFPQYFDKIVVDAPCSGEGMFRKDNIAIEEWSLDNTNMCARRQKMILGYADKMLKPGGILVYSTCTFAPIEDEDIVVWFLREHPDYTACGWKDSGMALYMEQNGYEKDILSSGRAGFVSESLGSLAQNETGAVNCALRLWPHKVKGEGHFVIKLKKNSNGTQEYAGKDLHKVSKGKLFVTRNELAGIENFLAEIFPDVDISGYASRFRFYGDNLYLLPEGIGDIQGIKVVRPGLHIAVRRKNRFEPAHALGRVVKPGDVAWYQDLDYNDALRFLHGETVSCKTGFKGWGLTGYEGFPLGWGKAGNGVVKNHYPKGLRI